MTPRPRGRPWRAPEKGILIDRYCRVINRFIPPDAPRAAPACAKRNKMSKVETLRNAVEYIGNLERLLATGVDSTDATNRSVHEIYRVLLGFTGFYWVLLGFT